MENTLTLTPASTAQTTIDPIEARAMYFAELELLELVATIPQADEPHAIKNVY